MAHTDIDRAIRNLTNYARREPWGSRYAAYLNDCLARTIERFSLTHEQVYSRIENLGVDGLLFGFLSEAFFTEEFDGEGSSVIAEYLKRRGWQETPRARRYLGALRDSRTSLYEIVDVAPGAWVEVRDVIRDTPVERVGEVLGSQTLVRWDRIGARVLEVNGDRMFAGGLLYLPRQAADSVQRVLLSSITRFNKEFAALIAGRSDKDPPVVAVGHILRNSPQVLVDIWLTHTIEAANRPPPQLHNTDGDPLLFSRARLALINAAPDDIIQRISALPSWQRETPEEHVWQKYGGPIGQAKRKTKKTSNEKATDSISPERALDDTPRTIVATAELKTDALIIETNSRARLTAALDELRPALEGLVGEARISHEDAVAALKASRSSLRAEIELPSDTAASLEVAQVLHQFKEQHYRRTLDEKIPMLGNRTPRQCARNPKQQALVIAWLKDIENGEQRQARSTGEPPLDMRWMWQELGLEQP